MTAIKKIIIIYNPNSTGDGQANAEAFKKKITAASNIAVSLKPTEHAGHAEEIVQKLKNEDGTMVISSSGDGGYHEVVNGILSHGEQTNKLIAGLLPSGNANDHYNDMHHGDTIKRIVDGDVQIIDVIKVTIGDWTRYAHSYAGIGLTPHIGEKLTAAKLNPINEIWLTIRHFFSFRPVKIKTDQGTQRYDSLIFSNVEKMSKYIVLSKNAKIDDGKFEVTGSKSGNFTELLKHIFKASTVGLTDDATHLTTFSFTSSRPLAIQLDGEVFRFEAHANVTISIALKALKCII
ncbi:MAG: diacylglycerol kinase family protein [Candidatus Saccharimonadales bacterium]